MIRVKTASIWSTVYFPSETKCAPYQKINATISFVGNEAYLWRNTPHPRELQMPNQSKIPYEKQLISQPQLPSKTFLQNIVAIPIRQQHDYSTSLHAIP